MQQIQEYRIDKLNIVVLFFSLSTSGKAVSGLMCSRLDFFIFDGL